MRVLISVLVSVLFITGCATKNPNIKSIPKLDLNRYLGSWYEIARFEHSFEKGCKNVKATYLLKDDDKIEVVNSCTDITTNKKREAVGEAIRVDNTNSKLKVSFFWPFYGDYWVIILADDYSYAVVSEPTQKYLWILSREKTLEKEILKNILNKLKELDFDTSKLIFTIQE